MKKVFLLFGLFVWIYGKSQEPGQLNHPLIQSPNSASLGIYDKIDISPFSGLANIGIPVFSLKEGEIGVNCQLSYFSGGVKPDQHPGWVGTNWSLQVGGQVTRKVNGEVDEFASYSTPNNNALAYYYSYGQLNSANWNVGTYMRDLIHNSPAAAFRPEPDEFSFSLPTGVSGSFYKDHLGNWRVKSKTAVGLKIFVDVNPVPFTLINPNNPYRTASIQRLIYVIVITDTKGIKYTFGNHANAIEFSRNFGFTTPYNESIIANTWNLTKIESPLGDVVQFNYVRKENQYIVSYNYPQRTNSNCPSPDPPTFNIAGGSYSGYIVSPVQLTEIIASNFKVEFTASVSNELKYPYSVANVTFTNFYQPDLDENIHSTTSFIDGLVKYYKLDNIKVKDKNNTLVQEYGFTYDPSTTKRLTLQSFRQKKVGSGSDIGPYTFTYNSEPLPAYNSFKLDKWGYFNNNTFPLSNLPGTEAAIDQYFTMNAQYAKAGILTEIQYPTGGKTTYTYEANDYSGIIQKSNNSISLVNESGTGGGLRIKEIVSTDNAGKTLTKKYYYTKEGSTASSGILAGKSRSYAQLYFGPSGINGIFEKFMLSDRRPLNYTDGKEVVYSRVKEENADGSYVVYNYANSDNPVYLDQAPSPVYSKGIKEYTEETASSNTNPYMTHNSMDLERGNLLSQDFYSAAGKKVKRIENLYNDDPSRFNQYVRSVVFYQVAEFCSRGDVKETYYQPVKIYTYTPYLKRQKEIMYDQNELPALVNETNYEYDATSVQIRSKKSITSDGKTITESYKYPGDFLSIPIYADMNQKNMKDYPVEVLTTETVGSVTRELSESKIDYGYSGSPQIIKPLVFWKSFENAPFFKEGTVNLYDSKGNVRQITGKDGIITTYLWGYNSQYPVAKLVNCAYSTVQNMFSQSVLDNALGATDDGAIRTHLVSLRSVSSAFVTIYTYKPLIGMTSETDVNGFSKYYEYDGLGRLILVRDKDNNVVRKVCYNYTGQTENCCTTPGEAIWQNTATPVRCKQGGCGNNGYTEQEQTDLNPCSPTYGTIRWIDVGYNPTLCSVTGVNISFSNTISPGFASGFTAVYTHKTTGQVYTFTIPASGTGVIGCIPDGFYSLTISKPGNSWLVLFNPGCNFTVSGTSATFGKLYVSSTSCNVITLENDLIEM